tara:strand:- start:516 stop:644 length:129 start_codon:yes stop_codon:yes gene_type:complete
LLPCIEKILNPEAFVREIGKEENFTLGNRLSLKKITLISNDI